MLKIIAALIMIESGGDPSAHNKQSDAVGLLQITPIVVDECNRIIGFNHYTLEDRWNQGHSRAMAALYLSFWCNYIRENTGNIDCTPILCAKIWRAGPTSILMDVAWNLDGYTDRLRSLIFQWDQHNVKIDPTTGFPSIIEQRKLKGVD